MKISTENIEYVRLAFNKMKSKEEFVELLNYVNEIIWNKKAFRYDLSQINRLSILKLRSSYYKQFELRKKAGGMRVIHAPIRTLKNVQKAINLIFQAICNIHPSASGFLPGKSIADNAHFHVGKNYVLNIDLKDFFPAITQFKVFRELHRPPFNLSKETGKVHLASLIANLCCHNIDVKRFVNEQWVTINKSVLPQGAPTSPVLSNIICYNLDLNLNELATKMGLVYSRYADDITFSSYHNVYESDGSFLHGLYQIILKEGFQVNESKFRLQKKAYKQTVTGLVVNEKVNVPSRYVKKIRMWLYWWEHYGYEKATEYFTSSYLKDKNNANEKLPKIYTVIDGKLNYLKMVKGETCSTYLKLKERFDKLKSADSNKKGLTNNTLEDISNWNKSDNPSSDPVDVIDRITQSILADDQTIDKQETTQVNDVKADKLQINQTGLPILNSNNQIAYENQEGIVTDNEYAKLALLFKLHNVGYEKNEYGTIKPFYEYLEDGLNTAGYVDSLPLLSPDEFLEGTELEVRVPSNFNQILVPIYNEDGTKSKAITFAQYVAGNNPSNSVLTPDMQLYKDKIPMIVYAKAKLIKERIAALEEEIKDQYKNLKAKIVIANLFQPFGLTINEANTNSLKVLLEIVYLQNSVENKIETEIKSKYPYFDDKKAVKEKLEQEIAEGKHPYLLKLRKEYKETQIITGVATIKIHEHFEAKHLQIPIKQLIEQLKAENHEKAERIQLKIKSREFDLNKRKGLAFVHDIQWYNAVNFLKTAPEKMRKAIDNTRKIREAVIIGDDNGVSISILEKKPTTFDLFKTRNLGTEDKPQYEYLPFGQAAPQARLLIAKGANNLGNNIKNSDGDWVNEFENNENTLIRLLDYKIGHVYDVRRAGWKDGKKAWYAFQVTPQTITEQIKTSIATALFVFINRNNLSLINPKFDVNDPKTKEEKIVAAIRKSTNFDLLNSADLRSYLKQFINVQGSLSGKFGEVSNHIEISNLANVFIKSRTANNLGYIVVQNSGSLFIGATNLDLIQDQQTVYVNTNSYDFRSVDLFRSNLKKKYIPKTFKGTTINVSILDTFKANYDKIAARDNRPVMLIAVDGTVIKVADTYDEYIKNTFTTNIKSENIAKEGEEPVYVTSGQMVSYELTSKLKQI